MATPIFYQLNLMNIPAKKSHKKTTVSPLTAESLPTLPTPALQHTIPSTGTKPIAAELASPGVADINSPGAIAPLPLEPEESSFPTKPDLATVDTVLNSILQTLNPDLRLKGAKVLQKLAKSAAKNEIYLDPKQDNVVIWNNGQIGSPISALQC